jgi:flagellin-like protein
LGCRRNPKQPNPARSKFRFILKRRALSPIFATLIILAVITILFIPIFIWATGTTSQTQESWGLSGLTATERIVIEEVSLKPNDAKIYVRNIGKTTVSINDVLIQLSDGTGTVHVYQKSELTIDADSVTQGNLITITIPNLGWTPINSQAYIVEVFTTRGVGDIYQVVT